MLIMSARVSRMASIIPRILCQRVNAIRSDLCWPKSSPMVSYSEKRLSSASRVYVMKQSVQSAIWPSKSLPWYLPSSRYCLHSLKSLCKASHKLFRMNKGDLRARPIFHRLHNRIEAHICICFTAYTIMLELERLLKAANSDITIYQAGHLTKTMYQLNYQMPRSHRPKSLVLQMDSK